MLQHQLKPYLLMDKPDDDGAEVEPDDTPSDDGEQQDGKKSPEEIMPDADDETVRQKLRKQRDAAGRYRTENKELSQKVDDLQDFKESIQSFFEDDDQTTEQQLSNVKDENNSLKAENKRLKTKQSIRQACRKHNGDSELIIPLILSNGVDDIEDMGETVKELIDNNSKLKAEQPKKLGDNNENGGSEEQPSMNDIIRSAAGH